ncbi:MAG: tRNA (N6-threonylcarbamoyladenosine(37)-N6)-methyltransferase TrmO [Pelovirga sp.]
MEHYHLTPIAIVHSPFREKFTTPRQAGQTPSIKATIEFLPAFSSAETIRELETFSHLWLLFVFHQHLDRGWHPTVRPPRLGGNRRVGVFASRSPFRPNPIGLSAVRLLNIRLSSGTLFLDVQGVDLIDKTPIVDIKPYVPYADSIPDALGGFANARPESRLDIDFTDEARQQLKDFAQHTPELETLIRETLCLDPRPAYRHQDNDQHAYGCLLDRYNVRWQIEGNRAIVNDIRMV